MAKYETKSFGLAPSIATRFIFSILLMGAFVFSFSYFMVGITFKDFLTTSHIVTMLQSLDGETIELDLKKVKDLSINVADFKEFLNDTKIKSRGFVSENTLLPKLIYVQKLKNGKFEVQEEIMYFWRWYFQQSWLYIIFLVILLAILIVMSSALFKITTSPLESLRENAENILAGRFEITAPYYGSDNLGKAFLALQKLCVELNTMSDKVGEISEIANKDGLTGLYNHRFFKKSSIEFFLKASKEQASLGLILLDIDFFKKFNDKYGHLQGDEVLRKVAKVLTENAPELSLVARYGGEEFIMILAAKDFNYLIAACEKLRKSVEAYKVPNLQRPRENLQVTSSFGALYIHCKKPIYSIKDVQLEQFISECDENLYSAKRRGRNCCVITKSAKFA